MKKACAAALIVYAALGLGMSGKEQAEKTTDSVAIGIEVGQKAPTFNLKDQFGNKQSNETLRGTKGTVLLFVRSADW